MRINFYDTIRIYVMNNLELIRHSLAHVLACAVKRLYPDVKFGIGPATDEGFYYDFQFSLTLPPKTVPLVIRGSAC